MLHVARPFGGVPNLGTRTGQTHNGRGQFIDRNAPPAGNVEDARGLRFCRQEHIRRDHVLDINEIPRLLPVAENRKRLPLQRVVNEDRHGGGILAARILTQRI